MKEKIGAFLRKTRTGKNKRTSLILSIVALVEVLLIMVVSTSAWVESISSVRIFNTYDPDSASGGTKGIIESFLYQKATFGSGDAIDLTKYFRPSGNYHLVGASSVNGKTMYFPNFEAGTSTSVGTLQQRDDDFFRIGTVNDKNVNYISFTIKTTNSKYLGFDAVPTIQFGNLDLSSIAIETDGLTEEEIAAKEQRLRSLVRLSVGDSSGNFTTFSLNDKMVDDVVDDTDGSLTKNVPVMSFADYVNGEKVVTTTSGGFLSFNLWIQDPFGEFEDIYKDNPLTITGLKLIPVNKYTAKVSTNNVFQTDATKHGGTVRVGNSDFDVSVDFYAAAGRRVKLYALANETKGFSFKGWSESVNGSSSMLVDEDGNSDEPFTYTTKSNVDTIYALFSDERVLYFDPKYTSPYSNVKYAAYIWYDDVTPEEFHPLTKVTLGSPYAGVGNKYVDKYYFAYRGVAQKIIFCYMDSSYSNETGSDFWNKRKLQTYDLTFPPGVGDYMYIATCKQIVKAENASINYSNDYAVDNSNGNRFILGYWDFSKSVVTAAYHPESVETTADPITGNTIKARLKYSTTNNSTVNYYHTGTSGSGMDYTDYVNLDAIDYIDSTYNSQTYDGKVVLTASASSVYDFNGWYTYDADNEEYTQYSTSASIEVEPDFGEDLTYYAKFTHKPEVWKFKHGAASGSGTWYSETMSFVPNTSNVTFSATLTKDQDYYFKVYDETRNLYYGKTSANYIDYISSTIIDNVSLSTSGGDIHIKGIAGTYTFTFDTSTKKLTVSLSNPTYPTVYLYTSVDSDYPQFTHTGTGNEMTCTKTIGEGDSFEFKIYDYSKSEWRRNNSSTSASYDGITNTTIQSFTNTSTSYNGNMYLKGHAGTYTFTYNYQSKQYKITASFSNITIELWDDTKGGNNTPWIGNDSAQLFFVTDEGSSGAMTRDNRHYTVSVPSNYCTSAKFERKVNGTTTNTFSNGSRGYKVSFSARDNGNSSYWY